MTLGKWVVLGVRDDGWCWPSQLGASSVVLSVLGVQNLLCTYSETSNKVLGLFGSKTKLSHENLISVMTNMSFGPDPL